MVAAALLAIGVIGAMTAMGRHAVPAHAAPGDNARALRRIAAALCGRAVLGVVGLVLMAAFAGAGRGAVATGVVLVVAAAACLINLVLLVGILRCAVGAASRWSLTAAFLLTWSLVIEGLQAVVFYRNWSQITSDSDASWLGAMTLLGPLAALAGLVALIEMIPGLVSAHRCPTPADPFSHRAFTILGGLFAAFYIHLPAISALAPNSSQPELATFIVLGHLLPQLAVVPLCLRAARQLDAAA